MGEVMMSCEKIRWIIEQGENALGPDPRHVPALLFLKKAQVVRAAAPRSSLLLHRYSSMITGVLPSGRHRHHHPLELPYP